MQVELAFGFGSDVYRVRRRYAAGKRSLSVLSFQVQEAGRWCSMGRGVVDETQREIENPLRLDCDTFVNFVFLRQGRADQFMVKTAVDRKRVLRSILGLDRRSIYEDRARGRQEAIQSRVEVVKLRLEEIGAELAGLPHHQAQVEAAQTRIDELAERTEQARQAYLPMESSRTELGHIETQIADQDERIDQAEQKLGRVREQRLDCTQRLAGYEQLPSRRAEIEAGSHACREAEDRERQSDERLSQSVELNERRRGAWQIRRSAPPGGSGRSWPRSPLTSGR